MIDFIVDASQVRSASLCRCCSSTNNANEDGDDQKYTLTAGRACCATSLAELPNPASLPRNFIHSLDLLDGSHSSFQVFQVSNLNRDMNQAPPVLERLGFD